MIATVNPATEETVTTLERTDRTAILATIDLARAASPEWAGRSVADRAAALKPIIENLRGSAPRLARLITSEMGKPISEAIEEVDDAIGEVGQLIDRATVALGEQSLPAWQPGSETAGTTHRLTWHPIGVAAVLSPFNYPVEIPLWGIVTNLLCGNAVVFKPSEKTIGCGAAIKELFAAPDIPCGLVGFVVGDQREGQLIVESDVDLIWFVGGSAAGAKIYARAAESFKRCVLELGGSSPTIILDDARLDDGLMTGIVESRFTNAGQVCSGTKRLLVHSSQYADVVGMLRDRISRLVTGDPTEPSTDIGPLVSRSAAAAAERQVQRSISSPGTRLVVGNPRRIAEGTYVSPVLITGMSIDSPVLTEELFSPVLPVVAFDDDDDAIRLANTSRYGLSAVVHGQDPERASAVASRIRAGRVLVNTTKSWGIGFPIEGWGLSGVGRHQGDWGFWELVRMKYSKEAKASPRGV